jgi:NhaP-type Na+/H+ or K+/H+ antiporter
VVETIMSILLPFVAYILAEDLSGSGVIAVVTAGLYIGYNSPKEGYATRLQERPLWTSIDVILEGFVFALIGLQLNTVVQDLVESERSLGQTLTAAAVVLVVVILVRPLFVFESYVRNRFNGRWFRPLRIKLSRGHPSLRWMRGTAEPKLNWRELTVISWTGMRGVVTLAAAVSVVASPTQIPAQDTIFIIAFFVTVGTLLLQGLTLRPLLRRLELHDGDPVGKEIGLARRGAYQAGMAALDGEDTPDAEVVRDRFKSLLSLRKNDDSAYGQAAAQQRALYGKALDGARQAIEDLRANDEIGDDAFLQIEQELDWLEMVLGDATLAR